MPVLTPSRVVVVLSLSLLSFLWTFGLPRHIATHSLPTIPHDAPNRPPEPLTTPEVSSEPEEGAPPGPVASGDKGEGGQLKQGVMSAAAAEVTSAAVEVANVVDAGQCRQARGASNVMVIVKTSKAEIYQKLPTHLLTLLSCVPNFAIFSDHAGTIDGYPVHDALQSITNQTKETHEEFREYEKIQQDESARPASVTKELDKWKVLPMVYQAYKMHPSSRFYVFIEADTSLSWTNLLLWTGRLDYRIPYYSGAPSYLGTVKFAQRGSGILLSNGALKQYAKLYDERYEFDWEKRIGRECCGDMVLATALTESHVEFYSAFPLLQGETPSTLDWTKRHWCAPVVSWHHMAPDDIDTLWSFQRNWTAKHGWEPPYLFRHAFEEFVAPHLADYISEWDNLSQDTKISKPQADSTLNSKENIEWYKFGEDVKKGTLSVEDCKHVCQRAEDCLQWKFRKEECYLGKVVRLGIRTKKTEGKGPWTSGWMVERIKKSIKDWGNCAEPIWKFNQTVSMLLNVDIFNIEVSADFDIFLWIVIAIRNASTFHNIKAYNITALL
ncbi:uncharacterized protein BDR25DRAFT_353571 [Lindgomyces ingoldianus]|uniref:Uncharacterized protein n=1 Tax=Lindgomyces ingoldianus TaxID=673940 RepID=A0ACB6R212_9PLEO|nr:uncharacterized protein BDR25DRAFT_353571 [Lindgomyces ingoldianus]KAF2472542.1 hypothetical protein BDR25DRAFT_353571 [Lindgomyces ingoldianus]